MKKRFNIEYEQKENYKLTDLKEFEVRLLYRVLEIERIQRKGKSSFWLFIGGQRREYTYGTRE